MCVCVHVCVSDRSGTFVGWDQTSDVQLSYLPYMYSVLCVRDHTQM